MWTEITGPKYEGAGRRYASDLTALLCGWRGRVFRCDKSSDHSNLSIPVSL
jgi:hypothetical protein